MPEDSDDSVQGVSTEPQRQALDAMSQELVRKLHAMVAEQEERVKRFAANEPPSPSSIPAPSFPATLPSAPSGKKSPGSPQESLSAGQMKQRPTITNGPQLPPSPPPRPAALPKKEYEMPKILRTPTQGRKEESGIGAGPISVIIIILIILIMRSCD